MENPLICGFLPPRLHIPTNSLSCHILLQTTAADWATHGPAETNLQPNLMVALRLLLIAVVLCAKAHATQSRDLQAAPAETNVHNHEKPHDSQAVPNANTAAAVAASAVEASRDASASTVTAATASGKSIPTATGGLVYTLLVFLTGVAFVGNGAFLVYVFWLSK